MRPPTHLSQVRDFAAQAELRAALVGVAPASEAEVADLAAACNARMLELAGGDPAKAKWSEYYHLVDADGSGQLSYGQFATLVRRERWV